MHARAAYHRAGGTRRTWDLKTPRDELSDKPAEADQKRAENSRLNCTSGDRRKYWLSISHKDGFPWRKGLCGLMKCYSPLRHCRLPVFQVHPAKKMSFSQQNEKIERSDVRVANKHSLVYTCVNVLFTIFYHFWRGRNPCSEMTSRNTETHGTSTSSKMKI